jgi:hypothetical protein
MKALFPLVPGLVMIASTFAAAEPETYREAVMADKPYAYYRLDEKLNDEAVADETGRNPGAFVNKPEVGVPGAIPSEPRSTAVRLARAQSQYIKLTTLGDFGSKISAGFSVEWWLKTTNDRAHQNVFGTANKPDFRTDFLVDIAYGGIARRLRIYCRDDHGQRFEGDFVPGDQNVDLYDNQWHYVVYVYEPGAAENEGPVRLYVDGRRQTMTFSKKGQTPELSKFNAPMLLGAMDLRGKIEDTLDGTLDEVAFYTAPLSEAQIVKHYRAAGYDESERRVTPRHAFGFPAPTPMTNADAGVRHEVTVQVPTKFTFERKPDQLIARVDLSETKPEKMTVGENMITGTEYRFVAYAKGDPAPQEPEGFGLMGAIDFRNAQHFFNPKFGVFPEEGKPYVVEMRWKIFETDIPPQHLWSPQGKKYKVVLEGTIRQEID